jgi:hypothetical protein
MVVNLYVVDTAMVICTAGAVAIAAGEVRGLHILELTGAARQAAGLP